MPFGNRLSLRAWPAPGPRAPGHRLPGARGTILVRGCRARACPRRGAAPVRARTVPWEGAAAPAPAVGSLGKEWGAWGRTGPTLGHRSGAAWHQPLQPGSVPAPSPAQPRLPGDARQCLTGVRSTMPPARPLRAPRSAPPCPWLCPSVPAGLCPGGGCRARLPELGSGAGTGLQSRGGEGISLAGAAPRRGRGHRAPLPPRRWRRDSRARTLLLEKFILPLYGEILFVVNSSVMNLEFL